MRLHIHPEDIEAAAHGHRRSSEWPRVERIHRILQPRCICCTEDMSPHAGVQVHHIFPFHYCIALGRPDLELDQRNLVSLCENEVGAPGQNHHLLVGHLDSFQSANLDALHDAKTRYHGKIGLEIRSDVSWLKAVAKRLKPLGQLSEAEKRAFVKVMNEKLPKLG